MKKKFAYVVGLIVILIIAMMAFHKVFSFKFDDGIYQMKTFYELEEDTVDVLVLGSSHAFVNINPMVIWEESGIATYELCGSIAPLWNSYYYLKEALRTQSPGLVILEGFGLTKEEAYADDSRIIKNVYGIKSITNKLGALKASAPEDRWLEFGLEYIQYHNRYKSLGAVDYKPYLDDEAYYASWKGFGEGYAAYSFEKPQVVNDGTRIQLAKKQEEYYRKIIELCKQENIPLLIAVVPYVNYDEGHMGIYNTAKDIAEEYGVDFCNFNEQYEEIGINWDTDFMDGDHMGYIGNVRFSRYLSDYLTSHYQWKSHADEREKYVSWDKALRYYQNNLVNFEISQIQDINSYTDIMRSLPEYYTILISVKGEINEDDSCKSMKSLLHEWGILTDEANRDCAWIISNAEIQCVSKTEYGYYWAKRFGEKELLVDNDGIYWNKKNYQKTEEGVNIVIFDEENQVIADSIGIVGNSLMR